MTKGIAVAGNAILDFYKDIDAYPEHSTLTTIRHIGTEPGGAMCNCAIDLARIDPALNVQAIGLIGRDAAGDELIKRLSACPNLDQQLIVRTGETSFTDVMVDQKNHTRTFFQFRGANSLLDLEHFDFEAINASIIHVAYILLLDALDQEDADYGTRMARLLARARQYGIKTSIDVVSEDSDRFTRLVPPALRYTDYCIINEYEASRSTGIRVRDDQNILLVDQVKLLCRTLFDQGVKEWVVIHSREGAVGQDKAGNTVCLTSLDIAAAEICNTTGAGDAFLSGTLYGAWKGYDLKKSIQIGLAAANRSLLFPDASTGVITEVELLRFYQSRKHENWPGFS